MEKLDRQTQKIFSIIVYTSIMIPFLYAILSNPGNIYQLVALTSIFLASITTRLFIIYTDKKYEQFSKIMIFFDLAIVYWILLQDNTDITYVYLFVLIGDAILVHSSNYSFMVATLSFLTYAFSIYVKLGYPDINHYLFDMWKEVINFVLFYGIFYVARYQIDQRRTLQKTMEELDAKTSELSTAYEKLKNSSEELEKMTVIEERNRIAREIHDTVGHTLTTVLVEIEAGKRLIGRNDDLSREKLELAQQQVRNGLNSIRTSVRVLKKGGDVLDILPSIYSLIEDTIKHTDVQIECNIEEQLEIPEIIGKAIYRFLQEGLTNGIKHGRADYFKVDICKMNDDIYFRLCDNGRGANHIVDGFGLSSMKERVEKLDGNIEIKTEIENGFCIEIEIPYDNGGNEDD